MPERHTWAQRPDGFLEVDGAVPTLDAAEKRLFDSKVWRWRVHTREAAESNQVPEHWVLGVIFAESGGDPNARSSAGAIGLMQLCSSAARAGHSRDAVLDPALNVTLGTRYLASLVHPNSPTLPHIASRYNAGQKSDGTPHSANNAWGMRENSGYIDRVVRASNYARTRLLELGATEPTKPDQGGSGLLPLVGASAAELAEQIARAAAAEVEAVVQSFRTELAELRADLLEQGRENTARIERAERAAFEAAAGALQAAAAAIEKE